MFQSNKLSNTASFTTSNSLTNPVADLKGGELVIARLSETFSYATQVNAFSTTLRPSSTKATKLAE